MVTSASEPTPPPPPRMKETSTPDNTNMVELYVMPGPDDDSDIVIQKISFDKSKTPFVLMSKDRPDAGCLGPCLINVMGQTFYVNNTYAEVRKILFG